MDVIGLCLWLIFVTIGHAYQDPLIVERATAEEARQVQEISDAFERRMRETRDVGSLRDFFLDDFVRRQIEAERASHPGQPVFLIPEIPISIETALAPRVRQRDWERLYTARLNFRYYLVLLIASRAKPNDLKDGNDPLMKKLFPSEVFKLVQADPFLGGEYGLEGVPKKYKIETLEEFASLTSTMEKATLLLRQRFLKDSPEQTRIYQENLRRAPNEQKTRREGLIWPHVYGTEEARHGFPKGTRFFHRITADSMFELSLVNTDKGLKIIWARVYPFN